MNIYTAYVRHGGLNPDKDIVLVKEGFCWPAGFFMPLWALWHGFWSLALGATVVFVGLGAFIGYLDADMRVSAWLFCGISALMGYLANDLWRVLLVRRGFIQEDVVVAGNIGEAEHYFCNRFPLTVSDT